MTSPSDLPNRTGTAVISTILIEVSDLAACEVFYDVVLVDALGFTKQSFERWGLPHIQYKASAIRIQFRPRPLVPAGGTPATPAQGDIPDFTVRSTECLQHITDLLLAAGMPTHVMKPYGDHQFLELSDPDGRMFSIANTDPVDRELGLLPD